MPRMIRNDDGKFAERNSETSTSGMTPRIGPCSLPAPPRSAMITTWKETSGLKAMLGSI